MASPFIKRYLLALNRYKWPGLFTFLSILGASSVIAFQPEPPPTYDSAAVLVDNSPPVLFSDTGERLQSQGRSQITEELLLSDILLSEVSANLEDRGINITPGEILSNTKILVETLGEARDSPTGQRVTVRFSGAEREVTETVMDTMVIAMIELSKVTNRSSLQAITTELDQRLPTIQDDLRVAEGELEAYDRLEGPAIQASLDGSLLGAISGSQEQLRANQITLAGIEAQMRSLQSQLGMTPEQAYASSALSADPLIAQLRAQISQAETQMTLLQSQGLRAEHPSMVELRDNLAAYDSLLQQRAAEVIGGSSGGNVPIPSGTQVRQDSSLDPARAALANQLVALDTQRDAILSQQQVIGQSARTLREQYSRLPNKQLERNRLEYQVGLRRALYDRLQATRVDAEAAQAETGSSLAVAKPTFTTEQMDERPAPIVVLLAGAAIGLVVAGGLIYLLDMLDGTVRTAEELEALLQNQEVPVLGMIPVMRTRSARAVPILVQPDAIYHTNYERFLSRLRLVGTEESSIGPRMIVLTSTRAQEGKSVSAYNLAIASARAGRRTLLIEADLRSASKAEILGLMPNSQVVMEPLRYYGGQVGNNTQMVAQVENLYVCASPGPQRQPAAVIESSEMQRFIKDARARFDMVILDTPSLTRCDDALMLEGQTDGIVLVARPGVTEKAVLETAIEELELSDDVRLLGAVINAARIDNRKDQPLNDEIEVEAVELPSEPEFSGTSSGRVNF